MSRLKGAYSNRWVELLERQMDKLKESSANCFAFEFRAEAYNANQTVYRLPSMTPVGYRDQVRSLVSMARARGLKVLFYLTPSYVASGWWAHVARVISFEPEQTNYIDQWKAIIAELQPDAVSILNECPDAVLSGTPELTPEKYMTFALRSIDAYRSVKPGLEIHMTSIPFWDMRSIVANPVPRDNVNYAFHFYYHNSGYNRPYEMAYNEASTETELTAARALLEQYLFGSPSYVQNAIDAGLPLNFIFGAEPRQMNNAARFLEDTYDICKRRNIESVFQSAYGVESYPNGTYLAGMWKADMSDLNMIGQVWFEQMPGVPDPPPPPSIDRVILVILAAGLARLLI